MARSLLEDAFRHHVWATLGLIDALGALSDEQYRTAVPGTYGTPADTIAHLVDADAWYLACQSDGAFAALERNLREDPMALSELRDEMSRHLPAWLDVLALSLDPDEELTHELRSGGRVTASRGIRLAQALEHGADHRSQLRTALEHFGRPSPDGDVWAYGDATRAVRDLP